MGFQTHCFVPAVFRALYIFKEVMGNVGYKTEPFDGMQAALNGYVGGDGDAAPAYIAIRVSAQPIYIGTCLVANHLTVTISLWIDGNKWAIKTMFVGCVGDGVRKLKNRGWEVEVPGLIIQDWVETTLKNYIQIYEEQK